MYPRHFFDNYPPFPRSHQVFVAMSFDKRMDHRWLKVIAPAIADVRIGDTNLAPNRVDTRTVSDSVLTEILTGIGNALLVVADVTSLDAQGAVPLRNPNVFYEVGIAHATRLPEEVLLFRSDKAPLLFDIANIRVNLYDPDGQPDAARATVRDAIVAAIREVDLTRSILVKNLATKLDAPMWLMLSEAFSADTIPHPILRTMGQALAGRSREVAITSLLELGLLQTHYPTWTVEELDRMKDREIDSILRYEITQLGKAVFKEGYVRLGFDRPEVQAYIASKPG